MEKKATNGKSAQGADSPQEPVKRLNWMLEYLAAQCYHLDRMNRWLLGEITDEEFEKEKELFKEASFDSLHTYFKNYKELKNVEKQVMDSQKAE